MSSRPPVLVTAEAGDWVRATAVMEMLPLHDQAARREASRAEAEAHNAWCNIGRKVNAEPTEAALTLHGYRPEHGDPLAWAAEQIEEAATTIRELRNDVGALEAANATLVDLITKFRDSYHQSRRGFLSRMFR